MKISNLDDLRDINRINLDEYKRTIITNNLNTAIKNIDDTLEKIEEIKTDMSKIMTDLKAQIGKANETKAQMNETIILATNALGISEMPANLIQYLNDIIQDQQKYITQVDGFINIIKQIRQDNQLINYDEEIINLKTNKTMYETKKTEIEEFKKDYEEKKQQITFIQDLINKNIDLCEQTTNSIKLIKSDGLKGANKVLFDNKKTDIQATEIKIQDLIEQYDKNNDDLKTIINIIKELDNYINITHIIKVFNDLFSDLEKLNNNILTELNELKKQFESLKNIRNIDDIVILKQLNDFCKKYRIPIFVNEKTKIDDNNKVSKYLIKQITDLYNNIDDGSQYNYIYYFYKKIKQLKLYNSYLEEYKKLYINIITPDEKINNIYETMKEYIQDNENKLITNYNKYITKINSLKTTHIDIITYEFNTETELEKIINKEYKDCIIKINGKYDLINKDEINIEIINKLKIYIEILYNLIHICNIEEEIIHIIQIIISCMNKIIFFIKTNEEYKIDEFDKIIKNINILIKKIETINKSKVINEELLQSLTQLYDNFQELLPKLKNPSIIKIDNASQITTTEKDYKILETIKKIFAYFSISKDSSLTPSTSSAPSAKPTSSTPSTKPTSSTPSKTPSSTPSTKSNTSSIPVQKEKLNTIYEKNFPDDPNDLNAPQEKDKIKNYLAVIPDSIFVSLVAKYLAYIDPKQIGNVPKTINNIFIRFFGMTIFVALSIFIILMATTKGEFGPKNLDVIMGFNTISAAIITLVIFLSFIACEKLNGVAINLNIYKILFFIGLFVFIFLFLSIMDYSGINVYLYVSEKNKDLINPNLHKINELRNEDSIFKTFIYIFIIFVVLFIGYNMLNMFRLSYAFKVGNGINNSKWSIILFFIINIIGINITLDIITKYKTYKNHESSYFTMNFIYSLFSGFIYLIYQNIRKKETAAPKL